jgi:hypothetical protein
MKLAIDTLMGNNVAVWQQAIRHTTTDTLRELSASWDESALPFVHDFLIFRKATAQTLWFVAQGERLILVEGAPLAGKSNVLREIASFTDSHKDFATLYIEGGVSHGVLRSLADALARSLNWPVTQEEARNWLTRISKADNTKLLLAIDGVDVNDNGARREIEDLSSAVFGNGLSVIVALDDSVAEQLVVTPDGRSASPIGRRAQRVSVEALDNQEFEIAQKVLLKHHITLMNGAYAAPEFRQPWVLRAISAPVSERAARTNSNHSVALPPLLSMELIRHARERFIDPEFRRLSKATATAVLADSKEQGRAHSLILESSELYVVRRETLKNYLDATELTWLIAHGYLKPTIHASGDPVLFVRLPELLGSELARLLADELATLARSDARQAAAWIAGAASSLPIGEVIAAQAIFDAVHRPGGLPFDLIMALIDTPPRREHTSPGKRYTMPLPGLGLVELRLRDDGTTTIEIGGQVRVIDMGDDSPFDNCANVHEWLILSHLAALPFAMETSDGLERVDPQILLIIGAADIVLRKPGGELGMQAVPIHDVPDIGSIVCHKAGVIEPITFSIFCFLAREGVEATDWIDQAIGFTSMPLLARIHIALLQISRFADAELAAWAQDMLAAKVLPAFEALPPLHDHHELN